MGFKSIVSECIAKAEQKIICDKCGKEYTAIIDDDFYINLCDGSVRHKCPHCNQEYILSFHYDMVKGEKNAD